MQAVVLVGGEGTRLRPLTLTQPKPALALVDRPFIRHMIEWLGRHGIDEVVMACGFRAEDLRSALGDEVPGGPAIRYVQEDEPLGTAGPIRLAADEGLLGDRFMVLNGDVLTDLDLTALLGAHRARGASATIGLHPVSDSSSYGLVRSGPQGEVLEFLEKTGEAVPGEVNAGMYALQRSVLDLIPPERSVSIERDVFPRLAGSGLHGLALDGYWMDIGTPERYLQASWDILEGRVKTRVEPTAPGVLLAADAEVAADAEIGPRAVIGPGCRVESGAQVRESVLLDRSAVGLGARVLGSILSTGAEVEIGATLKGAVVAADGRVSS